MEPKRTTSAIGTLISTLCKSADQLPKNWKPADLISLIKKYTDLVSVLTPKPESPTTTTPAVDDNMQVGRAGAYEAMVEDAMEAEQLRQNGQGYEAAQGLNGSG